MKSDITNFLNMGPTEKPCKKKTKKQKNGERTWENNIKEKHTKESLCHRVQKIMNMACFHEIKNKTRFLFLTVD